MTQIPLWFRIIYRYYIIITCIYWCGKKKKRNYLNGYVESCTIQYHLTFFLNVCLSTTWNRYNCTKLCRFERVELCKRGAKQARYRWTKNATLFSNRASKREHLREAGQLYKLGKSRLLIRAAENSGNNAIFIYYLNNRGAYTSEGATRGRYVPIVMGSSESRVRFEQIRNFPFKNSK